MDIEISITERLQKLKQWQIEQQEKLLKQQQIQRDILSHEKDRIYEALGLPIQDLNNIIESTKDMHVSHSMEIDTKETMSDKVLILQHNVKNSDDIKMIEKEMPIDTNVLCENPKQNKTEELDYISTIVDDRNSIKDYKSSVLSQNKELSSDLLIEGVKPLLLDNVALDRCISIDDIPLPSPKKDFQTLLEEKLKKETELMTIACTDTKAKPKKPFLKKGQGLSRFKKSINSYSSSTTTRRRNAPLSLNTQHINRADKSKMESLKNVSIASESRQLNLKTVPLPRNKIFNKSESNTPTKQIKFNSNRPKYQSEMNMSDIDSKAERELEEVRIFELLEEKAENSSFCSTSSTVLAFLQQSTPFKVKKTFNYAGSGGNIVRNVKQQNNQRRNDTNEREPMVQPTTYSKNSQCRFGQFDVHKRSHINTATINSCWDPVSINDTQQKMQKCLAIANQESQSTEARVDCSENQDASDNTPITILSSDEDEDEKGDIFTGNDRNLARYIEADANHRVRFSEYNEYRTINSTDMSDAGNKSPLKDYFEQQDWNDHSVNTSMSESSDVEEKLPLNYEEQMSSLKVIDNEKTVIALRRLSLQQDMAKNSHHHVMKSLSISEEKNVLSCKDESPGEDYSCDDNDEYKLLMKKLLQIYKEDQSVLSSSLSSSSSSSSSSSLSNVNQKLCTNLRKKYVPRNEPEKITEKPEKIHSNVREIDHYPSEDQVNRTSTYEPELLKIRLLELENEIDIFRKESSALSLQRRKLQEDQTILRKEYMEKERDFEENRRRVQNQLEEEKKKLAREKIAMENRIRDAQEKARQNKMERQKAQSLQEQLEKLRDDVNIKESRWNAAESRYKSELRALRVEVSKLKQEIARLKNVKRPNVRNNKKNMSGQLIAKAISQVNKRVIAAPLKEASVKMSRDSSDASSDTSIHDDNNDEEDKDKNRNKSIEPITKAIDINNDFGQAELQCNSKFDRRLYETPLKDATLDLVEKQDPFYIKQDISNSRQPIVTQMQNSNTKNNNKSCTDFTNGDLGHTTVYTANNTDCCTDKLCEKNQDPNRDNIRIQDRISPEKNLGCTSYSSSLHHQMNGTNVRTNIGTNTKDIIKQIQYSDGHIEYWYSNGNVKKIFPDQGITKMIYYNGDVRETDTSGKIKYFYATSRTWHTTTPDGLEILEFPDGQVEKHTSNGTVEVSFPDGAVRIAQADGAEKWSLPDGTIAETFVNGDKILTLPNGQREIHTKSHKRREYPDGTVKLIYADGTQETRYSNGRKRLRDKDGNLLMDSYDS